MRRKIESCRRVVLDVYSTIFAVFVFGAVSLLLAALIRRFIFPGFHYLIHDGTPELVDAVRKDWWLIPAFVFGALFLWAAMGGGETSQSNYGNPDNVVRGRRVSGPDAANLRAYNDLLRRRNRRRRQLPRKGYKP